jgi:hypothetical protein
VHLAADTKRGIWPLVDAREAAAADVSDAADVAVISIRTSG